MDRQAKDRFDRQFSAADPYTREEIGGLLEQAFQKEGGHTPNQADLERILTWAEELEQQAHAAEGLAREAQKRAEFYLNQADSPEQAAEWERGAYQHLRHAYGLYQEDLRLRQHLGEAGILPTAEKLKQFRRLERSVRALQRSLRARLEELERLGPPPRVEVEGGDEVEEAPEELALLRNEIQALHQEAGLLDSILLHYKKE